MSTEAVSFDGGAPAPAESAAIIDLADADRAPSALGSQIPEQDQGDSQPPDKPSKSIDDALDKAIAKQAEKPAEKPQPKVETKPVPKPEEKPQPQRGEHGHFASKEQSAPQPQPAQQPDQQAQRWEAPSRFSTEGKQHWETAPEPVKAEVHRAIRELESGLHEHQQRWEPLKQYDELAKQSGTTLHEGLERYIAFDRHLSEDLVGGLEGVIRDKTGGQYGIRDIAAHVLGQSPDQNQSQADAATHQTNARMAQLETNIRALTSHIVEQARTSTASEVQSFSQGKDDFEVLAPQIAEHIRSGKSLPDAYAQARSDAEDMARKLGFIPQGASRQTAPLNPEPPTPAPLNPAGTKSVSGSPSTPTPVGRKKGGPLPSIDETLSRLGL
jgi:hypothetical protein